jgi:hypothetical protein
MKRSHGQSESQLSYIFDQLGSDANPDDSDDEAAGMFPYFYSSASVHDPISVWAHVCFRVFMLCNLESRRSDAADDIDTSDEDFDIEEDVDELVGTSLAELPRFDEILRLFHKVPLRLRVSSGLWWRITPPNVLFLLPFTRMFALVKSCCHRFRRIRWL